VPLKSLALSVYLPSLILSFCSGLLLPILPVFSQSFGVSYGLIGLVLAGEALGTLLADLPAGSLIRRLDRKWVMALGIGLVALSVTALFWSQTVWEVLLYRVISGFGAALWNLSRHAYLSEATSKTNRGRAIALFGGTNRLGGFLGPVVGGLLAAQYGLRLPFLVFGVLALCTIPLALVFIEKGQRITQVTAHPHVLTVLREHWRILLTAGLGQLGAQTVRAARNVLIPLYGSGLGLGLESVGLIMSLSALVDVALFYPAGVIMDKLGRKYAIVPSFTLQALGLLVIPFAGGFVGLLVAATLTGLGNGLSSGTMMTLGSDLAPKESLGEFLGFWRLIGDSGFTGGPVIVGVIADVLTLPAAAVVMAAIGLVSAGLFAFGVPETHPRIFKTRSP
jgi:MFS family permease